MKKWLFSYSLRENTSYTGSVPSNAYEALTPSSVLAPSKSAREGQKFPVTEHFGPVMVKAVHNLAACTSSLDQYSHGQVFLCRDIYFLCR